MTCRSPVIAVPTLTPEGDANGAHTRTPFYAKKFSGKYAHPIVEGGVGRNLPKEAQQDFAKAAVEVDGYRSAGPGILADQSRMVGDTEVI